MLDCWNRIHEEVVNATNGEIIWIIGLVLVKIKLGRHFNLSWTAVMSQLREYQKTGGEEGYRKKGSGNSNKGSDSCNKAIIA